MNKIIQYAVHQEDGIVWSRVGNQVAVPILQYDEMTPENNFTPRYKLDKLAMTQVGHEWRLLRWTRKIPLTLKNRHRIFWGFAPLDEWAPGQTTHKGHLITAYRLANDLPDPNPDNAATFFAHPDLLTACVTRTREWVARFQAEGETLASHIHQYERAIEVMRTARRHGGHPADVWYAFQTLACLYLIAQGGKYDART